MTCRFCGGDLSEPNHQAHCDGQQGWQQGRIDFEADFDGETYERPRDHERLRAQLGRVLTVMRDGTWHTLADISARCGDPEASISARLRDLRKEKFGAHLIERRYVHDGLWEYRLASDNGGKPNEIF